jgi:hypothetical protein
MLRALPLSNLNFAMSSRSEEKVPASMKVLRARFSRGTAVLMSA